MKFLYIALSLIISGNFAGQSAVAMDASDIFLSNDEQFQLDEFINGTGQSLKTAAGGGSVSTCRNVCSLPCTYWFDTPLYKGYCYAPIVSCRVISGGGECTCNGKGNAPFYRSDEKHTKIQ